MTSPKDSLANDVAWGLEHDAFNSPLGQSLLRLWQIDELDVEGAEMLLDLVKGLKVKQQLGQLAPFMSPLPLQK